MQKLAAAAASTASACATSHARLLDLTEKLLLQNGKKTHSASILRTCSGYHCQRLEGRRSSSFVHPKPMYPSNILAAEKVNIHEKTSKMRDSIWHEILSETLLAKLFLLHAPLHVAKHAGHVSSPQSKHASPADTPFRVIIGEGGERAMIREVVLFMKLRNHNN